MRPTLGRNRTNSAREYYICQVCLTPIYGQGSIVMNTVCTTEMHKAIFVQKGFYYLFIEHIIP